MKRLITSLLMVFRLAFAMDVQNNVWHSDACPASVFFPQLYDEVTITDQYEQYDPYEKVTSFITKRVPLTIVLTCLFDKTMIYIQRCHKKYVRIAIHAHEKSYFCRYTFSSIRAFPLDMIITPDNKMHLLFRNINKDESDSQKSFVISINKTVEQLINEYKPDPNFTIDDYIPEKDYTVTSYDKQFQKLDYDTNTRRIQVIH